MKIKEGDEAPDFCLPDQSGKEVCLSDLKGSSVALYFYPRDNTPGCSMEAKDFSEKKKDFQKSGTVILGVSKDSTESHQKFIDRKNLTIRLLSDGDSAVQKSYGVWRPKKFMGREFLGTVRSTFLIDPKGKIARIWDPVKVRGHADDVLEAAKALPYNKKQEGD